MDFGVQSGVPTVRLSGRITVCHTVEILTLVSPSFPLPSVVTGSRWYFFHNIVCNCITSSVSTY